MDHPVLHTMLGNYPDTAALKKVELKPKLFDFDFAEVKVANQLFKSLVRDAKYDIGELAIGHPARASDVGKNPHRRREFFRQRRP